MWKGKLLQKAQKLIISLRKHRGNKERNHKDQITFNHNKIINKVLLSRFFCLRNTAKIAIADLLAIAAYLYQRWILKSMSAATATTNVTNMNLLNIVKH